ncbi:MAG: (2Fe-2S)-binding protein [Brevinema sp.]
MVDKDQIICSCLNITLGEIESVLTENLGITVEEIIDRTGAGSICGMCVDGSNGVDPCIDTLVNNQ